VTLAFDESTRACLPWTSPIMIDPSRLAEFFRNVAYRALSFEAHRRARSRRRKPQRNLEPSFGPTLILLSNNGAAKRS